MNFRGTGVAVVTPFNKAGEVDFPSLKNVITHIVENKAEYLVIMGTTGETPTISTEEKKKILQTAIEHNGGKAGMIFGIGGNDTRGIINKFSEFDLTGVDAILSVSPYYNSPSQKGIVEHFTRVADASPRPIILYNVPSRTGSNLTAETTLELSQHPNILGVKEASGNLSQCMHILINKPDDFSVISGDDALTLPMLALGASGVISVIANAFPFEMSEMVRMALKNDLDSARKFHRKLCPMMDLAFAEGNPTGIKAILNEMGKIENNLRLPLIPASENLKESIKKSLGK